MESDVAVVEGVDADEVARRVAGCRSVARLSTGRFGEVATYLPGRRVPGVRTSDARIEVHVVARWGVTVADLATEVRRAVTAVAQGMPVDVHVDDVDIPDEQSGTEIHLPDSEEER
jgi:uncharacterized alkaline shock family protein YloU